MVLQEIKDKEKQGDKEARRQRRRVDVTREIWEDPGKIQGRSRGQCDREGERNKVEKRREDMRGGGGCIRERAKGESRGSSVFSVKDARPTQMYSFLPASWAGDTHEETDFLPIGDREEKGK